MTRSAPIRFLVLLLLCGLPALSVAAGARHPAYTLMVDAADHMLRSEHALYAHKLRLGLFDPLLDPARSGLIGAEYTSITTTLGSLKSKRTAANPDFAAWAVRVLVDHGIGSGDSVLVTMTGSFPGLNLAVVMALETLGVSSLRVCSLGASSYGANQEEFTWLDMEDVLLRAGLLLHRCDFVTLGGTGDVGGGLPPESKDLLRRKAQSLGYPFLKTGSLKKQTALRREQLRDPKSYRLLINIGGNQAMLGKGKQGRELPGGWIDPASDVWQPAEGEKIKDGIVFDFLQAGVPVLNLLHVEDLARTAGLPFDPQSLPQPGESAVYHLNGHQPSQP